jgi:thiosulfate sulfurtransferase
VSYQCISPQQAMELMREESASVIDIRDAMSFSQGHIAGARHIEGSTVAELLEDADADEPLIVCCYHGISSRSAAEYFAAKGFSRVYSLDGGYEGWKAFTSR